MRTPTLPHLAAIACLAFACNVALLATSCVTKNPKHTPEAPKEPAYIVAPTVATVSNTVAQVAQVAAQLAPQASPLPIVVSGIFTLIGAISAYVARQKSATASTLAAGVVTAGAAATQAVLDHASLTPQHSAVVDLVAKHAIRRASTTAPAGPVT